MPLNHSQSPMNVDVAPDITVSRDRPLRGLLSGGAEAALPNGGNGGSEALSPGGLSAESAGTGGDATAAPEEGGGSREGAGSPPEEGGQGNDDVQGLLQQAYKLLYADNFDKTFRWLLTSRPEQLPSVAATMINVVLGKLEQANGQISDDALLELGVELAVGKDGILSNLKRLGVDVPEEFMQKALGFAIILWIKNHPDRIPPDFGDTLADYLRTTPGASNENRS